MPRYEHNVTTGEVTEHEDAPIPIASQPSKAKRIAAITVQYTADVKLLREAWLAAAVADGDNEVAAKANVQADIAALKEQFIADVAAIRSST